MKTRQYGRSKLKNKLLRMKDAKKKNPIWALKASQVKLIEAMGFPVKPYIYGILTKPIPGVQNKCGLLKSVHYSYVRDRIKVIHMTLTPKDKRILRKHRVRFKPSKHEIDLQGYTEK